jgi:uncharacterized protein (TIGR02453 family)
MDFTALTAYLAELAFNNNKPWFDEHRPTYERLRGEWTAFVGEVIAGVAQFDPAVSIVSPKATLFRINRDVHFSKDKTPYKTAFSAAICPTGRNSGRPSYYFHITEAAELMVAGGVYMPEPGILGQVRKYIAEHPERLQAVLADPHFADTFRTIEGEKLKRPPQGYDASTPGIETIKLKSFTASIEPKGWLGRQAGLADEIVTDFKAMFPLIRWLREALTGHSEVEYLSPQDIDRLAGM